MRGDSIWMIQRNTLDGRVDYVAQRFLAVFHFTPEQLAEKNLLPERYTDPDEAEAEADALNMVWEIMDR